MFADAVTVWLEDARARLGDVTPIDVHTHVGTNDPAGFHAEWHELLGELETAGAKAITFPLHEPDGYRGPNRAVIEQAAASNGRVSAFARLDPGADPLTEAHRSLDAGAAGFKLHPRAERFALDDPRLDPVFAIADERRLPIMVHAGTGAPGVGGHALRRAERYPRARLILAHCGLSDLAWLWRHAPANPHLLFDTSWWQPSELIALFALIPPGQILLGSDLPYAPPTLAIVRTVRCAVQAGLSDEQIQVVAGRQAERLLTRADLLDAGTAAGEREPPGPLLERLAVNLGSASEALHEGAPPGPSLEVARHACAIPADAPGADVGRAAGKLLDDYERVARSERPTNPYTPGFHLVQLAAFVARTPAAGVPPRALRSGG